MDKNESASVIENTIKFFLDYSNIEYEYENSESGYFDFTIFHNNKRYLAEVKAYIPDIKIIDNLTSKYLSLKKEFETFFIIIPQKTENKFIYYTNIYRTKVIKNVPLKIVTINEFFEELGIDFKIDNNTIFKNLLNEYNKYEIYKNKISHKQNISEYITNIESEKRKDNESNRFSYDFFQRQFTKKTIDKLNTEEADKTIDEILSIGKDMDEIIVCISDIKNFSSLVRLVDHDIIIDTLQQYYDSVRNLCSKYNVFLDKYIGDSVVVAFNYPYHEEVSALNCLEFCFDLIQLGDKQFKGFENIIDEKIETGTRVGISIGKLYIVKLYSNDISFLGNSINLAARLESNCPVNQVLITQKMQTLLSKSSNEIFGRKYTSDYHELDSSSVKGQFSNIKSYLIKKKNV